jgi:hypothetical protein
LRPPLPDLPANPKLAVRVRAVTADLDQLVGKAFRQARARRAADAAAVAALDTARSRLLDAQRTYHLHSAHDQLLALLRRYQELARLIAAEAALRVGVDDPNYLAREQVDALVRARLYALWMPPDGDAGSSVVAAARDVDNAPQPIKDLAAMSPAQLRQRLSDEIDSDSTIRQALRSSARHEADYQLFREKLVEPGQWAHHLFDILFDHAPRLLSVVVHVYHPGESVPAPAGADVLELVQTPDHYMPALRADRVGVDRYFDADPVANGLLAALRSLTQPGAVRRDEGLLGPDVFSLRRPPEARFPSVEHRSLRTGQLVPLLRLLDLAAGRAPEDGDLTAANLPDEDDTYDHRPRGDAERSWATHPDEIEPALRWLPERLEIPRLIHSIWFGSPLTEDNRHQTGPENAGRDHRPCRPVSRGAVDGRHSPGSSRRPRRRRRRPGCPIRTLVCARCGLGKAQRVLVINVDEVYHAGRWLPLYGPPSQRVQPSDRARLRRGQRHRAAAGA